MKKWNAWLFSVILCFGILSSTFVLAEGTLQDQVLGQVTAGAAPGFGERMPDPRIFVTQIIKVFLSVLGSVFFILIVMSGYWYLTAHGEDEKVEKAQKTIRGAVFGLITVLLAYGITSLVGSKILDIYKDKPVFVPVQRPLLDL